MFVVYHGVYLDFVVFVWHNCVYISYDCMFFLFVYRLCSITSIIFLYKDLP